MTNHMSPTPTYNLKLPKGSCPEVIYGLDHTELHYPHMIIDHSTSLACSPMMLFRLGVDCRPPTMLGHLIIRPLSSKRKLSSMSTNPQTQNKVTVQHNTDQVVLQQDVHSSFAMHGSPSVSLQHYRKFLTCTRTLASPLPPVTNNPRGAYPSQSSISGLFRSNSCSQFLS